MKHLIVGSGKMSRHFAFYLNSLFNEDIESSGQPGHQHSFDLSIKPTITAWNRSQPTELLYDLANNADRIWLLISDNALESFYQEHLQKFNKMVIHFSGALEIHGMIAAHPLMTFSTQLYGKEFYPRIPFIIDRPDLNMQDLVPETKNPTYYLSAEHKPYYHALCVLGGNLPHLLWQKMRMGMLELGLPDHVIDLYLDQNLKNFKTSPENSLTGPLARKDLPTITKNLNALKNDPYQNVYQSFVDLTLPQTRPS